MDKKSITLLLTSLGAITFIVAYAAGLFDWILDYAGDAETDIAGLLRNTVGLIALLAYTYFGIRFFNRFGSEQV